MLPEQGKINRELWVEEDRRMWIMEDNILSCQENELSEEMKRTDYIYMVSRKNLIISLNAELDHHLADEMREVIDEIIDERGVNRIIIDFSKVGFMDSAGIGLIMGRYKKIRDKGDISVVGADESIKRILLISGLHKIVYIYDNLMDAVKKENRRDV